MASLYKYLIHISFAIVVSILFFVFREQLTLLDIISYCFILFAYFVMTISPSYTKNHINKTISDLPLYACSFVYLVSEILLAIVTFYYGLTDKEYTIIQTILTGVFLIVLFIVLHVNKITNEQINSFQQDANKFKNTRIILEKLLYEVKNDSIKQKINELIEIIKTSPIQSSYESSEIENNIFDKLNDIDNATDISSEEIISQNLEQIKKMFLLRNNILKH